MFQVSNAAINALLKFFATFLTLLFRVVHVEKLYALTIFAKLPTTLNQAKVLLNNTKDNFVKFVSCPNCHSLYQFSECIIQRGGTKVSALCDYKRFPNHPQSNMRQSCKTPLMKTVCIRSSVIRLYPHQVYCYKSPIDSLFEILQRPGVIDLCEKWRNHRLDAKLWDVYDGRIWQEFISSGFLTNMHNYCLLLNCDWYQPFEHSTYSLGIIYYVIQNLPRSERFKSYNISIIGIIPGPKEPSLTIQTYLEPLVNDLQRLWRGVQLSINGSIITVRAALTCISCDIPALRKVAGFVGHNATRGCTRCLKEFSCTSFGEKLNYGGFNMDEWEGRNHALHYWYALKHKAATTVEMRKDIEKNTGVRYSPLVNLPYYDAVRFPIIDPMHMLFLGIAKYMLKMWLSLNIITDSSMGIIQNRIDNFVTPASLGRIPYKIASGFSNFSADQWKNWTLYYSLFGLKGLLPYQHYNCWHLFVKICNILCTTCITSDEIDRAQKLILEFCKMYEVLYGSKYTTMNLHLLCHITECIKDHGPIYSFWLFPLERMNGVLGSYHTNNKDIGPQIMRKIQQSHICSTTNWPTQYKSEFESILLQCHIPGGSLLQTLEDDVQSSYTTKILPPAYEHSFDSEHLQKVTDMLRAECNDPNISVIRVYKSFKALRFKYHLFAAKNSRYSKAHIAFVTYNNQIVLAEILSFLQCYIDSSHEKVIVASVSLFMAHPCRVWFGSPVEVWSDMQHSQRVYIHLNSIFSTAVYTRSEVDFGRRIGRQKVIVAIPVKKS